MGKAYFQRIEDEEEGGGGRGDPKTQGTEFFLFQEKVQTT